VDVVSVRAAIYTLLTGDDTLTDLLASTGAVYHEHAPVEAARPLVIFNRQSGTRIYTFGGEAIRPEMWLVKAVTNSQSASSAEAIDARLEALLNDAALSISGSTLLHLRRDSDVQYAEQDGHDTYQHVGGLYRLIHQHD
jgi:hypothetical protein